VVSVTNPYTYYIFYIFWHFVYFVQPITKIILLPTPISCVLSNLYFYCVTELKRPLQNPKYKLISKPILIPKVNLPHLVTGVLRLHGSCNLGPPESYFCSVDKSVLTPSFRASVRLPPPLESQFNRNLFINSRGRN
jgi:hypothetical protein